MNRISKLFLFAIIALFLIIGSASANIQNSKLSSLSARKLKAQDVITSTLPSSAAIKSRINRMLKENSNIVNNYGVRKLKQLPAGIPRYTTLPDPTDVPASDPTQQSNQPTYQLDDCAGKFGRDFIVCKGAQVIRDEQNTSPPPPSPANPCENVQNLDDLDACRAQLEDVNFPGLLCDPVFGCEDVPGMEPGPIIVS